MQSVLLVERRTSFCLSWLDHTQQTSNRPSSVAAARSPVVVDVSLLSLQSYHQSCTSRVLAPLQLPGLLQRWPPVWETLLLWRGTNSPSQPVLTPGCHQEVLRRRLFILFSATAASWRSCIRCICSNTVPCSGSTSVCWHRCLLRAIRAIRAPEVTCDGGGGGGEKNCPKS